MIDRNDLKVLIKNGFSDTSINSSPRLMAWAESIDTSYADMNAIEKQGNIRSLVYQACEQYPTNNRYFLLDVLSEILDAHNRTYRSPRRTTWKQILEVLKQMYRVEDRRVEQIVANELAPQMEAALRNFDNTALQEARCEWRNCALDISARSVEDDSSLYWQRAKLRFDSADQTLLTAITDQEDIAEAICRRYNRILDVSVPSEGRTAQQYLYYDNGLGGMLESKRRRIERDDVVRLVGPESEEMEAEFYVYDCGQPPAAGALRTYELILDQQLSVDTYFFWVAPRRLEMTSISIDLSGFPGSQRRRFRIIPRLGDGIDVEASNTSLRYRVRCDKWVLAGQSVQVTWSNEELS